MSTEMDEEIKETTDIDGNMRDEFAIFPISLNRYPYVYSVSNSASSSHEKEIFLYGAN